MPRPLGSKNKPKETVKKKVGRPKKTQASTEVVPFELEEDITKLRHTLDRIPMLSDDGYRIKETIGILKMFGYSSEQVKLFLTDGTIPLK